MSVLSLADAKSYLNITSDTEDAELQGFIDAAEAAVSARCGPLESVTVTERVRGETEMLQVTTTPVISLTSVTPVMFGVGVASSSLFCTENGQIECVYKLFFEARFYDVVYVAGRSSIPRDLYVSLKEVVRHLWLTQRGPGAVAYRRLGVDMDQQAIVGAAYAFTYRAKELFDPYVQMGIG